MNRVEKLKNNNKPCGVVHERTKEEREPTLKGKFYFVIILILFSALVYLVFFSGIFEIKNIEVEGYQSPDKIVDIVREVAEDSIITNNILFINKYNIETIVLGDSRIRDINIKRVLPNKIKISITESTPEIIWVTAGENLAIDSEGYVLAKTNNIDLVTVFDGSNIEVSLGERVASPTFINFIKELDLNFEPVTGMKIVRITIFDTMSDVHVLSSENWTVYLNASKDAKAQLENLNRVLDEVSSSKRNLEYIDMRLDTRIYYK